MKNLKIMLVDDHSVVREGVRRLLAGLEEATLSEATNGQEAIAFFRRDHPDLVLLDLNLKGIGGLELLRRLLLEDDKAHVIVFSMHAEPIYAARALRLGARGYVSKSAAADELVTAVKRVSEGGYYIERELAAQLAAGQFTGEDPLQLLTTREIEILRLLGEGKSLTGISETLGIAYKTVANSCSRLKEKLGLTTTAELIRFSISSQQR
jgi:two-component system, NarL family, invasion response regulator UvrY